MSLTKRRVLHVIDHTDNGGAQVMMVQILRTLNDLFSFGVAVLNNSGKYSDECERLGIPVYHLGKWGNRWNPTNCIGLERIIRQEKFELIHSHLFKANILGIIAGRRAGCKTILHDHSATHSESLQQRSYLSNALLRHSYLLAYRFALRLGDRIIVLTPASLDFYIKSYSVAPQKMVLLPNAVDISSFVCSDSRESKPLLVAFGLPPETKIVTMVARLEPQKDWDTFLQIAEDVQRTQLCPCVFVIVGSGSEEQRLKHRVLEEHLNNVVFLGHRDDVPDILAQTDVFILTSRNEPFGIALLEAMAAGCPVIATHSAGPESIITNEVDGLLAKVGDVGALVNNVTRLLNDAVFGRALGHQARQTVRQRYSLEDIAKQLASIYKELLICS